MTPTDPPPAPPRFARPLPQVSALSYATAPKAHTYRAIIQVFFEAKQHYLIELRPQEVLDRLRQSGLHFELQDPEDVEPELCQLVAWGNLKDAHDTGSVSRLEDFYRHRLLYHLTAVGEAAHRAVLEVEATVGKTGSLQASMLVKIRDALVALVELSRSESPLPDSALRALHDLHSGFDTLTVEANRFIGELDRTTGQDRLAEERFTLYKEALLAYIGRFLEQLRRLSDEIRAAIEAIGQPGAERLIATAARSADLPPALGDVDPALAWIAEQRQRWLGICVWFVGDPQAGGAPTVERLAGVAVDAVVSLTRTLHRINERRARPVDRGADFRTLARWFSACPDEREAHALFHAAFGLTSARHFHLEEDDGDEISSSTSFWDAPPVDVPIRLRTKGSVSATGRPAAVPDHSLTRQWIAQKRRREREQLQLASKRFAGRGPLAFCDLKELETAELDVLLSLLDEALGSPLLPGGARETRSADGRWIIRLEPPDARDSQMVSIATPRGTLRCRNYRLTVAETFTASRRKGATKTGSP
jgi:uncharacterized protein (TIGR02677 family)